MGSVEKVKKPFYKKWLFWVIIAVVAIAAIFSDDEETTEPDKSEPVSAQVEADDEATEPEKEDETDEPEEEPEEKTEFGVNEKVEFEGRVLEVMNIEKSSGSDFESPKDGHEYVIVTVLIENNSDKEVSYNPFDFKMQNSQGQIESQTFTIIDSDTSLSSGDLAPGGSVTGTLVWEQPIDDDGLVLIFEPSFWSNKQVKINLN